jgi:hypothetical protein
MFDYFFQTHSDAVECVLPPLENYYGAVQIYKTTSGHCYMSLDDHSSTSECSISEKMFVMFKKEFPSFYKKRDA